MFIAAAAGGGVIWRASHGNYSDYDDYSDYYRHSNHSNYGDAEVRRQISSLQSQISNKEANINNLRTQAERDFNSKISALKSEKNYDALQGNVNNIVDSVKTNMRRELEEEILGDQKDLEKINKMISKINEIALQSQGVLDKDGYDKEGYDVNGFDKDGYDKEGYDKEGYDRYGLDRNGYED